jgi:hypothetical protein
VTDAYPMLVACATHQPLYHPGTCELCGAEYHGSWAFNARTGGVCATCALQYEARGEAVPVMSFGWLD